MGTTAKMPKAPSQCALRPDSCLSWDEAWKPCSQLELGTPGTSIRVFGRTRGRGRGLLRETAGSTTAIPFAFIMTIRSKNHDEPLTLFLAGCCVLFSGAGASTADDESMAMVELVRLPGSRDPRGAAEERG